MAVIEFGPPIAPLYNVDRSHVVNFLVESLKIVQWEWRMGIGRDMGWRVHGYMNMIRVASNDPHMSTNAFFYLILKCSNGQDINMRQI